MDHFENCLLNFFKKILLNPFLCSEKYRYEGIPGHSVIRSFAALSRLVNRNLKKNQIRFTKKCGRIVTYISQLHTRFLKQTSKKILPLPFDFEYLIFMASRNHYSLFSFLSLCLSFSLSLSLSLCVCACVFPPTLHWRYFQFN